MCAAHLKPRKSAINLSNAEKIARRDEAIVRIAELLAERPHTVIDLAAAVNIVWNTVYGYLRYMQEVGDAHQTGRFDGGRRELWAAGRAKPGEAVDAPDDSPRCAWIVPARQMGMLRDPLVAALFGPAQKESGSVDAIVASLDDVPSAIAIPCSFYGRGPKNSSSRSGGIS